MKTFRAPEDSIGGLDAATAATLVAAATDVALVMDGKGIIQDVAFQQSDLSLELEGYGRWYGRPWSETVSADSQSKVATLLREATSNVTSGWRQLTHQNVQGRDVPILYSAVKLNGGSRIVALGRDMRAVASLQQKLIDAQMSMERDYAKLRFAETRYRLLFLTSSEPIVVVDANAAKVLEANPAVCDICGAKRITGRPFAELFDIASRPKLQAYLADLRNVGRAEDVVMTLADSGSTATLSATLFRHEASASLLVRVSPATAAPPLPAKNGDTRLSEFMRASPDGFVLVDASGRVLVANLTFATMIQLADAEQVRGEPFDQWLGRPGVDFDVMMVNLRQHGALRLFVTSLRSAQGSTLDVEISAVALGAGKTATFGFVIRDIGRRLAGAPKVSRELPRSAEQLTELIGRVPLKDIVRETTDFIEKLCIEAALELTDDNRASAAEVLGLSRQSLYVKLRRFGLDDPGAGEPPNGLS